jgi:hypothetical protein
MALLQNQQIDQSQAQAGGDITGGNKVVLSFISQTSGSNTVSQLHEKLKAEIQSNNKINETVSNLQYFMKPKPVDEFRGLEAKLTKANRSHEILNALDKKELFAQFLEKWSLYESAQEIFACFLAKIEHVFVYEISLVVDQLDEHSHNELITKKVVEPTIAECGSGAFNLNHAVVMGMIYWLAEKCFVRWHK